MNNPSYPIMLESRATANGETVEWFLTVDGAPVYPAGNANVGVFTTESDPVRALPMVLLHHAERVLR